ncbi:sigma-70 family RNA polymerase sigma factor [Rubinisphaera margarita]|uniref:sigma-70 family RNA polymerase sigma factor n=1 Tax=Rubinisphaera margarita TaxID=2909586 RepID=UPI001EE88A9E|nr:sigma-70 family RNA polymerase sigma factor [Rubinisphaera margarita]MCG6154425.1 sigma-70 family RNA polymerase sigma factor [Rubinisphaera margarita]
MLADRRIPADTPVGATAQNPPAGARDSPTPLVSYIASAEFAELSYDAATLYRNPDPMYAPDDGESELGTEYPLLSPSGEAFLFRKLNYLRYRAAQLLDQPKLSEDQLQEVEEHLIDARSVRNQLARCSYRLTLSLARSFATNNSDFDDFVSEANVILLGAIDKFDYQRGFRFSTYATNSIQRHFYRFIKRNRKRQMVSHSEHESIIAGAASDEIEFAEELVAPDLAARRIFDHMDRCLDFREQSVIRQRFSLEEGGSGKTLAELAQELGISSERVRQIQVSALKKLKQCFGELNPETQGI